MLIAITGHKGHGKDTIGNVLINEFNFVKYSLADPLKRAAQIIFDLNDDQVFGDYKFKDKIDPRFGVSPRKIMQVIGTELFQYDIYKHLPELEKKIPKRMIWALRFKWWYKDNTDKHIVITDMRFLHESLMIRSLGGIILKVFRPGLKIPEDLHASETDIDNIHYDFLLISDEDIEKYREKGRELFKKILS